MVKEQQEYTLHSANGLDYKVIIENVNLYRSPEEIYAVNIIDPNGTSYYSQYGDLYFCGDDFIKKCVLIK